MAQKTISGRDFVALRQTALTNNIPYYTTVSGSRAAAQGRPRIARRPGWSAYFARLS